MHRLSGLILAIAAIFVFAGMDCRSLLPPGFDRLEPFEKTDAPGMHEALRSISGDLRFRFGADTTTGGIVLAVETVELRDACPPRRILLDAAGAGRHIDVAILGIAEMTNIGCLAVVSKCVFATGGYFGFVAGDGAYTLRFTRGDSTATYVVVIEDRIARVLGSAGFADAFVTPAADEFDLREKPTIASWCRD